jgi:hypothetical protein
MPGTNQALITTTGTATPATSTATTAVSGIPRVSIGGAQIPAMSQQGYSNSQNLAVAVPSTTKFEYRLHTLEKHNYTIWKAHTRNVLEAKGLLAETLSEQVVDSTKEMQARALLTSALSEDNQMKVINCQSAYRIWKRLEAIYENKSSFERENLLNKLHSYKIRSTKEVSTAISDMESTAAKLRLLGETVSDESIMSAILRALPKQFNTFVTIWKGTATAERTIDNLLTRLMAEVADNEPEEKALVAGNMRFNRNPRYVMGSRGPRQESARPDMSANRGSQRFVTGSQGPRQ